MVAFTEEQGYTSVNFDENARLYILALKKGEKPAIRPEFGPRWEGRISVIESIYTTSNSKPQAMKNAIDAICRADAELTQLLSDSSPTLNSWDCPALPDYVRANEALADQASPILDAIIKYLKLWCTRSYEGYHEAVALWVLSTIAARRIVLKWRKGIWPVLYIMLVSKSGRHAKTEAASYGVKIIRDCGLGFLLAPDETTPQSLLSKMNGKTIPRNYSLMNDEEKNKLEMKLAFSAQKGWMYDEFGDFLQEIIKGKGCNTQFYRLLKQLYDNKPEFTYETVTRGEEKIDLPSLSLIGTTTPESLSPITGRDSTVWTDGAFARIAFIVPPEDSLKLDSAPDGEANVPPEIIEALQGWNEQLGIPECHIVDIEEQEDLLEQALGKDNKKNKDHSIRYRIDRDPLPQKPIYWNNSGVREAHEAYYKALVKITHDYNIDARLAANYIRFPDMALKIAMLLASLENRDQNEQHIDKRHWARGQAITERWRRDLHTLMSQLSNGGGSSSYGALEDAVIHVLSTKFKGKMATPREISQAGSTLLRNAGSPKVREICEELSAENGLARDGLGRSAKYGIKPKDQLEQ